MGFYIIELPKFRNNKNEDSELKEVNKWLKFIENPEVIKLDDNNKQLAKARKILDDISSSPKERYLAELREKYIIDQELIKSAGYNEGLQDGKEKKKLEIAKNMKKKGTNIDFIIEVTGLPKEKIEKL